MYSFYPSEILKIGELLDQSVITQFMYNVYNGFYINVINL
jgi:hypothetical protein